MKKTIFTAIHIVSILKQQENGLAKGQNQREKRVCYIYDHYL